MTTWCVNIWNKATWEPGSLHVGTPFLSRCKGGRGFPRPVTSVTGLGMTGYFEADAPIFTSCIIIRIGTAQRPSPTRRFRISHRFDSVSAHHKHNRRGRPLCRPVYIINCSAVYLFRPAPDSALATPQSALRLTAPLRGAPR